jgi:uncharacterized membrane protein YtjA (UPF0391 family)
MKKYSSIYIWSITVLIHSLVCFSGVSVTMLGIASLYIIVMVSLLIVREVWKNPLVGFDKLVFICILHMTLLFFDLFAFFFSLSLHTGNFHSS